MQSRFLEKRVEILERTVEGLSELPARVEALEGQVSQLRTEMRSEFSAVRDELAAVQAEIRKGDEDTRTFARVLHEDTVARIKLLAEGHENLHQTVAAFRLDVTEPFAAAAAFRLEVTQQFAALARQLAGRPRKTKR